MADEQNNPTEPIPSSAEEIAPTATLADPGVPQPAPANHKDGKSWHLPLMVAGITVGALLVAGLAFGAGFTAGRATAGHGAAGRAGFAAGRGVDGPGMREGARFPRRREARHARPDGRPTI